MQTLYETANNKGLFLYSHNTQLVLCKKENHSFHQPVILADDYDFGLTSVVFNSTVYYSYVSLHGNLITRSILENTFPCTLSPFERQKLLSPCLSVLDNHLVLFYFSEDRQPEQTTHTPYYSLHCLLPYENKKIISAFDIGYDSLPSLHITPFSNGLLVILSVLTQAEIYHLSADFSVTRYAPYDPTLPEHLAEKEEQISHLRQLLASAKTQYNDLMQVAEKYREEALKWSSKFIGK